VTSSTGSFEDLYTGARVVAAEDQGSLLLRFRGQRLEGQHGCQDSGPDFGDAPTPYGDDAHSSAGPHVPTYFV
jgi:hypothetical protein